MRPATTSSELFINKRYERRKASASSAHRSRDKEFDKGNRCRIQIPLTFARLTAHFTDKSCYHLACKIS